MGRDAPARGRVEDQPPPRPDRAVDPPRDPLPDSRAARARDGAAALERRKLAARKCKDLDRRAARQQLLDGRLACGQHELRHREGRDPTADQRTPSRLRGACDPDGRRRTRTPRRAELRSLAHHAGAHEIHRRIRQRTHSLRARSRRRRAGENARKRTAGRGAHGFSAREFPGNGRRAHRARIAAHPQSADFAGYHVLGCRTGGEGERRDRIARFFKAHGRRRTEGAVPREPPQFRRRQPRGPARDFESGRQGQGRVADEPRAARKGAGALHACVRLGGLARRRDFHRAGRARRGQHVPRKHPRARPHPRAARGRRTGADVRRHHVRDRLPANRTLAVRRGQGADERPHRAARRERGCVQRKEPHRLRGCRACQCAQAHTRAVARAGGLREKWRRPAHFPRRPHGCRVVERTVCLARARAARGHLRRTEGQRARHWRRSAAL